MIPSIPEITRAAHASSRAMPRPSRAFWFAACRLILSPLGDIGYAALWVVAGSGHAPTLAGFRCHPSEVARTSRAVPTLEEPTRAGEPPRAQRVAAEQSGSHPG